MSPRKLEARQCAELLSLAERDGANAFADRWYQSVDLFQSAFAANEPRADVSVSRASLGPKAWRWGHDCAPWAEAPRDRSVVRYVGIGPVYGALGCFVRLHEVSATKTRASSLLTKVFVIFRAK